MEGFVLAGGRSRRMGRDKADVVFGGLTLLERAVGTLREAGFEVRVVRGDAEGKPAAGCPGLVDLVPGAGPLGGILTALTAARSDPCAVLACDIPLAGPGLFTRLLDYLEDFDAAVPVDSEGRIHPLCAIYRRRCLPGLADRVAQGRLKTLSWLASPTVRRRLVSPLEHGLADRRFLNVNSPSDLDRLA